MREIFTCHLSYMHIVIQPRRIWRNFLADQDDYFLHKSIFIPHISTLSHTRQNHTHHHHQSMSSNKISTTRLLREYRKIKKDPPDYITARPLENNVLQWHYVIEGPPKTPYASGIYHGVLTFPPGTSCLYLFFSASSYLIPLRTTTKKQSTLGNLLR